VSWPVCLDARQDPAEWLSRAARHVRAGGLLAYPTETVYGLGGGISEGAVAALRALKSREPAKPFLLLVPSRAAVAELRWTRAAEDLAAAFWPGALTLVLADPLGIFPSWVGDPGRRAVGVRVSPHPVVELLVHEVGPLTSTSLNAPGERPAASGAEAVEVVRRLGGRDVLVLDAGTLPPSGPSTVVDCVGEEPVVVREGTIPINRLRCAAPGIHAREFS
jgi:L-threonylcarbamoyladenylate synthase